MAKGKYAVRAATTRAENAAEKIQRLEALLAKERADHAAEATGLKNQVQQLAGRLTREVAALADAQVAQAHTEARETVEAERNAKALEAYKLLLAANPKLEPDTCVQLCELLGIHPGEAIAHYDISRGARRMSGKRLRHALDKFEQGDSWSFNMPAQTK